MGIFDDNLPEGFKRSSDGWLKAKKTAAKTKLLSLVAENAELKNRLAQLEDSVSELLAKKKK